MNKILSAIILLLILFSLGACQGEKTSSLSPTDSLQLRYAELITSDNRALLGQDYQRVAVDASVYKGLMQMLGVEKKCLDFSAQVSPDIEQILAKKVDLLLLSAYDGVDVSRYEHTGVPLVMCRDFQETSPLARAEWMRYLGRLWGVAERADSLFDVVENNLCLQNTTATHSPLVIFDTIYGNQWFQPVENSSIGQLVAMTGGRVVGSNSQQGGSVALSAEQMLVQAGNADFWFIRYAGNGVLTLEDLGKMNSVYSQFKAFREGKVYVSYVDKTHYFEETAFRPDLLLQDIQKIMSGKFVADENLRYFCRLK